MKRKIISYALLIFLATKLMLGMNEYEGINIEIFEPNNKVNEVNSTYEVINESSSVNVNEDTLLTSNNIEEKEFRGIWVSNIFNLDYPNKPTTNEETLKSEAIKILDNAKDMGFNAIILQVRSSSDSIYNSKIFPWSKYLTGIQGKAPENNFDPLQFFIEEAHNRGLELHAWINPYRITKQPSDINTLSLNNPAVLFPELTFTSEGNLYFNPGEPKARQLIVDGVKEILDNYEVDGIHLDDYFYPSVKDYNDIKSFEQYGKNFYNINDWRINNNNLLVSELNNLVHAKNPNLKFGVSPSGIWANKSSNPLGSDTKGWESLKNIYADSRYWVKQNYVDYIVPQIYWNIGFEAADYKILVNWWSDVVKDTDVKLYIGQAAYKVYNTDPTSPWYGVNEIERQINLNRTSEYVDGYMMFRYKFFSTNPGLYNLIKELNKETNTQVEIPNQNYEYRIMEYDKNLNENEDYIVMYSEAAGKKSIIPRSRYYDGKVIGISNKTGSFYTTYNEKGFTDINEHPLKEHIKYIASRNIILGYNGKFNPNVNIKRGDYVLMLMRLVEIENTNVTDNFKDVNINDYYYNEIATAKKYGLINGVGYNLFAPEKGVTRQDLFVMTYRALDALNMISDETIADSHNIYKDKDEISEYALEAIGYFTQKNVLTGDNGNVKPMIMANRSETAAFLAKLLKSEIMIMTTVE
jgi:uncharacterized lipoprotein YddW (UPF0748 family)